MDKRVEELLKRPQSEQRTLEWYVERKTKLTASSIASLLINDSTTCDSYIKKYNLQDKFIKNNKCCNPYSSFDQFMIDKCNPERSFVGNVATYHGQKYEPVVTDLYSVNYKTEVIEFGLLTHADIPWLAASPDGITTEARMIEIKCPYRRKITGIPPFYYYIQCLMQLECCNLDKCDFVEYEFVEYQSLPEYIDDHTINTPVYEKGIFIQIESIPDDFTRREYIYPNKNILKDTIELLKWKDAVIEDIIIKKNWEIVISDSNGNSIQCKDQRDYKHNIKIIYWKVPCFSIITIERDPEWFKNVYNRLKEAQQKLLYYQKNNNYLELIKKRQK